MVSLVVFIFISTYSRFCTVLSMFLKLSSRVTGLKAYARRLFCNRAPHTCTRPHPGLTAEFKTRFKNYNAALFITETEQSIHTRQQEGEKIATCSESSIYHVPDFLNELSVDDSLLQAYLRFRRDIQVSDRVTSFNGVTLG